MGLRQNLGSINIYPSSIESTSEVSVYTSKKKWALLKNKKNHQIYHSITQVHSNHERCSRVVEGEGKISMWNSSRLCQRGLWQCLHEALGFMLLRGPNGHIIKETREEVWSGEWLNVKWWITRDNVYTKH